MTSRLRGLFTGLLTPRQHEPVHFHAGPDTMPAVCFDARCDVPRLDV